MHSQFRRKPGHGVAFRKGLGGQKYQEVGIHSGHSINTTRKMRYGSPADKCLGPQASLLYVLMGWGSKVVECAESTELHDLRREAVMIDRCVGQSDVILC